MLEAKTLDNFSTSKSNFSRASGSSSSSVIKTSLLILYKFLIIIHTPFRAKGGGG